LVERDLAKVEVAGSSPVVRSREFFIPADAAGMNVSWLIGFWWGELHRTTIEPSTRQFGLPA